MENFPTGKNVAFETYMRFESSKFLDLELNTGTFYSISLPAHGTTEEQFL